MHHVYFIRGAGSVFEKNKQRVFGNVRLFHRRSKDIGQLVADIGVRCFMGQTKIDMFVRRMIREVRKSLEDDTVLTVYIIGHSYGGYVSSVIVKTLKDHPHAYKLDISTYGSIYVLEPKEHRGIRMRQYMHKGDVALRCNKLSRKGIKWIKNSKKSKNFIDEWKYHLSYDIQHKLDTLIKKLNSS